ncbi:MAG: PKD domain-containing protein [Candidatus Nanopelagicales bacterium]
MLPVAQAAEHQSVPAARAKETRVVGWQRAVASEGRAKPLRNLEVSGPGKRPVVVEKKVNGEWVNLKKMRTTSDGRLNLAFLADTPGTFHLVVRPWGERSGTTTGSLQIADTGTTAAPGSFDESTFGVHRKRRNKAPTAAFTTSASDLVLSVDGSGSSDSDGTVSRYAWTWGDGASGTGKTASHTYAAAGSYQVSLTVTDNSGTKSTVVTKTVSVSSAAAKPAPVNAVPTAAFTTSASDLVLSVDGSGSTDEDGTVADYAWTWGDGATGTGKTASHTYAAAGSYQVSLTVTDNSGARSTAVTKTVTVTAPAPANVAPTAAFTTSASDLVLSVDGSGSTDSDGTVAGYAWTWGDGATGTGKTASHTYAAAGSYQVSLTVTDNSGARSTAVTKTVTVTAPAPANVAPTAAFTTSASNLALSVDGSGSSDSDGTVAGYAWTWGDGATGTGKTASHTYAAAGSYQVSLTVTDNSGARSTAVTKTVTVTAPAPANVAPTAAFTTSASNLALSVDGSGSSDSDGTVAGYAWTWGDGATGTGKTASHTYAAAGSYQVSLTVTDNSGARSTAVTKTVTVTAPVPPAQSAVYGTSLNADTLANLNMGGQWAGSPSYRFTAEQSSTLNAVRVHLLEPTHGPGYAGGTGGTIRMTVQTDNGGVPSGTVLASRDFRWADANGSNFPQFSFSSPARLTAGQRYHLVFTNIDSSPASNYMSLNNMYTFTEPTPRQPNHSDSEFFTTLMKEGSGAWTVWTGYTPNVDLTYGNGAHQGQGVMDIDTANGSVISGSNNLVRERITVSGSDRVVSGAAFRIARNSGTGNLVVRLEDANGSLIDSFSVPTSSVPVIDSGQDGKAGVWVSGTFSTPRTLSKGSTYNLRLSTNSSTSLWTRGIQQGQMYGFDPSTYFADGQLEVSTNGGSSWDIVPGLWQDGDLQFYFN